MNVRVAALALAVAPGLGACGDDPVAPAPHLTQPQVALQQNGPGEGQGQRGTGLVLESLTGVSVPLIDEVGEVVIDQAVITSFGLVEDAAGAIVGLAAEGTLDLSGGALGTDVVTQEFNTVVSVTSSGPGQCEVVSVDLGPVAISPLDLAEIDVPAAGVEARGSGAVGSLLCNVGSLLSPVTGVVAGVRGLINALNRLI